MDASRGDRIVVEAERVDQPERTGTIEEVLEGEAKRFRVRWDDGRTTIFVPSAGSARVERSESAPVGR
ncbi:MAG: DUF1918 domain-containing protein [Thermoleophilia bacterium]|nr:DUF1918 domain-containing protein [Thermoleophilia bacterium]